MGRLLTWEEWLNEKKGNIPFDELSSLLQVKMKVQYDYDKKERLTKQDAKTASLVAQEIKEGLEKHFSDELFETQKKHKDTLYDPLRTRLDMKIDYLRQLLWHFKHDVKWQSFWEGK